MALGLFEGTSNYCRLLRRPVRFVAVANTGSIGDAEPALELGSVGRAEPGPDHACTLSGSKRRAHHHAEPRAY